MIELYKILMIWLILFVIAFLLILKTKNRNLYLNDIRYFITTKSFLEFIFRFIILFAYLPLNIFSLLREIKDQQ